MRFQSLEVNDEVLSGGFQFFYGKPLTMQAWCPEMEWKKKNVDILPIWIEINGLDLKY